MVRTRGGPTNPSASREARLSASAPQDPSQASQTLTMPSFEGRVPFSPPQHRYLTRRPPTSPPPEPSVRCVPPKRARTSGPGETSIIIKRPMVTTSPISGNSDCRAKPFHSEFYFDMEAIRQVVMDFYQSMTTQGAQSLIAIHFSIDGRQGILEARHIAEALHIPFQPEDLKQFRHRSTISL
ncbi:hypothetical protein AAG906_020907 [Vitis piasezkii]